LQTVPTLRLGGDAFGPPTMSAEAFGGDAIAVLTALEGNSTTLVGHNSYGGSSVLLACASTPRVLTGGIESGAQ